MQSTYFHLNEAPKILLLRLQSSLTAISFIKTFGEEIVTRFSMVEAFVDSTYKTNSKKLELFVGVVPAIRVQFPLADLLLQNRCDGSVMSRLSTFVRVLSELNCKLLRIRPEFFHYPEDEGQIPTIEKT